MIDDILLYIIYYEKEKEKEKENYLLASQNRIDQHRPPNAIFQYFLEHKTIKIHDRGFGHK